MVPQDVFIVIDVVSTLILCGLALDHFITGAVGVFFPKKSEKMSATMFGVTILDKDFYQIIIRPWGALGIFAAVVGFLPILNPVKYEAILYALAILLALRLYYRFLEMRRAKLVLGLSMKRNFVHIGLIFLCLFALVQKIVFF